jgi:DNA-binding Lrp family transcriptional regulator
MSEKRGIIHLNKIDISILRLLAKDGRMRDIDIARTLNISDDTIRRHRERLEKQGYIKIEAVFNPRKFGYTNFYELGLVLTPGTDTRMVAERLAKLDLVVFVALSLGPTHAILANCRSKDPLELNRLIEELRTWKEIERIDVNIIYDAIKTTLHRLPDAALDGDKD